MREPMDDPAQLEFRAGNRPRRKAQGSQAGWIVVALVGAVLFVFLIRSLLERTSASIGGSVTPAQVDSSERDPAVVEGAYDAPAYRSPDEEGFYPSTGMVYRCVSQSGDVSLQSEPCGPDTRMTKAIQAPPEREPVRSAASAAVAPVNANASAAQYARIAAPVQAQRANACEQARRNRDATLEQVGLARTYALLQRLDEMVNEACK